MKKLMKEHQFSERRACRLVGISRSSLTYQARPDRHARLRERLITLSGKHRRYGYRMLHAKLVRENFRVNVKVVERIYREERLWLRRTKRKKIPREGREGAWCPIAPNQRWSLDFTSDALANGRKFRTANLKDDCTRECPAIEVDFSLPGERVVEMLGLQVGESVTLPFQTGSHSVRLSGILPTQGQGSSDSLMFNL
ncbi:MAG: IS3 family transposase, partial [Thermaurantiacus sp.]